MEMLEAILLIWRSLERQIKGHGRSIVSYKLPGCDTLTTIVALFRSYKNLDELYCSNFQPKIRGTKHSLI